MRGETYAYWYLRRHGCVFVAKNYTPRGIKGELNLVGYDGKTLAFIEVRTRTVKEDMTALPELSVTSEKQRVVVRTAQRFLAESHVGECPLRFDVLAIDNRPGLPPVVRLHKDAFANNRAAGRGLQIYSSLRRKTSRRNGIFSSLFG